MAKGHLIIWYYSLHRHHVFQHNVLNKYQVHPKTGTQIPESSAIAGLPEILEA